MTDFEIGTARRDGFERGSYVGTWMWSISRVDTPEEKRRLAEYVRRHRDWCIRRRSFNRDWTGWSVLFGYEESDS